jgi:hypothetical protein
MQMTKSFLECIPTTRQVRQRSVLTRVPIQLIKEESAMKLTGDLKEKVEKAENQEEAKKIIKDAGMELTDEEMDQVAGGFGGGFLPEDMFRQVG